MEVDYKLEIIGFFFWYRLEKHYLMLFLKMLVCVVVHFKLDMLFLLISRVIDISVTKTGISPKVSGAARGLFGSQSRTFWVVEKVWFCRRGRHRFEHV